MNKQVANIMDVVIMVLVVTLLITTGVSALIRTNTELSHYTLSYEDKTVAKKYTPSEKIYGTYDGSLSKGELLLMTQIQDYDMPYPHKLFIDDTEITINAGYKDDMLSVASSIWSHIKSDVTRSSYKINYNYASNAYVIEKGDVK